MGNNNFTTVSFRVRNTVTFSPRIRRKIDEISRSDKIVFQISYSPRVLSENRQQNFMQCAIETRGCTYVFVIFPRGNILCVSRCPDNSSRYKHFYLVISSVSKIIWFIFLSCIQINKTVMREKFYGKFLFFFFYKYVYDVCYDVRRYAS